ncbi:MAG: hypothetical protein P4M15_15545 [Alphaproteobacteria bacterium]|nr:hypothetical protein [Alphaproteobacteria bacterium]
MPAACESAERGEEWPETQWEPPAGDELKQDAEDKGKEQAADKGAADRRFDGFEEEVLAVPGVHQGFALPDRKSLFKALGDVAGKVFHGLAARRAVMMVVDFLMVNFLALDEGDRFRVRGDFLDLRGGDFRLFAAFQKAFAVAHNGVVSKCFGVLNG